MNVPLIVGNWKMYVDKEKCEAFFADPVWKEGGFSLPEGRIAILPPAPLLGWFFAYKERIPFLYGAQDCSLYLSGAYTGEISVSVLEQLGCRFVLLGHSERRKYFGETDDQIARKLQLVLSTSMTPILCIGENWEELSTRKYPEILKRQLISALEGLSDESIKRVVIAYEPVWAIGTGRNATIEEVKDALDVILFQWKSLVEGQEIPQILYGGSVEPENASDYAVLQGIQGVLVGGASAHPRKFFSIIRAFFHQQGVPEA
ncbi:MAG: triose-phosphate isomerase family protein [bacterium]